MGLSPDRLQKFLTSHPYAGRCWIAFSGGMDSTVLLHLAATLSSQPDKPTCHFKALHVHHGLHEQADVWADHCRQTAAALGLDCHVCYVDASPAAGESLEAAARQARYRAIRDQIETGDIILVAHHRDDQAETLLLQLFRGAGVAGLASMPVSASLGSGTLLRPLLDIPRSEMVAYAGEHGLRWIEDPSNQNTAIERNFLRHTILPQIREHWPAVSVAVARSAGHCAEALEVLATRGAELFSAVHQPGDNTLNCHLLTKLSHREQKEVIRYWFKHSGQHMPSTAMLDRILTECLQAKPDRNPLLRWSEGELRRYRASLYLLHQPAGFAARKGEIHWEADIDRLDLPDGNGTLVAQSAPVAGISPIVWKNSRITIRYRHGGEKIRLPGRAGTHELRKLFQESGVPPWIRDRIPLVYLDGQLACIGGRWLAADWIHDSNANAPNSIIIEWKLPTSLQQFTVIKAGQTARPTPDWDSLKSL